MYEHVFIRLGIFTNDAERSKKRVLKICKLNFKRIKKIRENLSVVDFSSEEK